MSVLFIAEIFGGSLAEDATAKSLTAAKRLGDVTILCLGSNAAVAAQRAAQLNGASKVLFCNNPDFEHDLAEPVANHIASNANTYTHIVAPATSSGKTILPRVSALLDVMIIPDVVEVISDDTFERPTYAGNAIQTVKSIDPIKVLTVRTSNFDASSFIETSCPIEEIKSNNENAHSQWVENKYEKSDRPELTSAGVVVSGGRGVGSQDDFALIEKLADKLGGAVGASRAAVDAGYAPNDWQVGQTGKIVAPELYVAVGISGAIQHLAGMKDSKVIVTINKDEESPIFQVADVGLVADLFEAVPELIEKL